MRKSIVVASFTALALTLGGCASSLTGDTYSRDEARAVQTVRYGTIESLRPVKIEGTKTPIGSGAGAVVGGVAGSGVGGGRGSAVAAVIGAVAGGMLGAAAEEGSPAPRAWRLPCARMTATCAPMFRPLSRIRYSASVSGCASSLSVAPAAWP